MAKTKSVDKSKPTAKAPANGKPKNVPHKVNKSAAIREAIQANPKAKAKEIAESLGSKGIKVTIPLVYYIKSHSKKAKRKKNREAAVLASKAAGLSNPVEAVTQVKALANSLGGIQHLKRLVDLLAE